MARGTRLATQEYRTGMYDFSGGVIGSASTLKARPRHLRRANNLLFRPLRAMTVRGGSRSITSASFAASPAEVPHSLGRFYSASSPKLFAGTDDGATRRLREVAAGSITTQTLPFTPSAELWGFDMMNAALIGAQRGGSEKPIFFETANPANTWHSIVLPTPGATMTLTGGAGGSLTALATYRYRLRWRHKNGSSLFSTAQSVTLIAGQQQVAITTIPIGTRSDYLGWTLERQKANVSASDPYFVVKNDGTAGSHTDGLADADLFYRVDDGIHGEPPHFDGVIHHIGRLMGWAGSTLYVSQAVADLEQTGPFNFHPLAAYVFATDDGDAIQTVIHQADRLLVCKYGSLHALEGDAPLSFRPIPVFEGVGAVGPRAAASFGSTAFVFSSRGLHIVRGNEVTPFGWNEVGQYLDDLSTASIADVVLENWKNELLLVNYKDNAGVYQALVYDLRLRVWSHFTGWNMRDSIVLRDGGFSNATLLFADPVARKVWSGFDGLLDGRASDGSGGTGIPWMLETAVQDDGEPETWKDFEWFEGRIEGGSGNFVIGFDLGPGRPPQSLSVSYSVNGARVQPATKFPLRCGPGSNAAYVYKIASAKPAIVQARLPQDTVGRTHALTWQGSSTDGPTIYGYGLGVIRLPERSY